MAGRFAIEAVFKGVDGISGPVRTMQRSMSKFTKSASKGIRGVDSALNGLGRGVKFVSKAMVTGFTIALSSVVLFLRAFSKFENARAAFQPILGSFSEAEKLVSKLKKTAASTPFNFDTLAQGAKVLIAMGAAGQDTVIPMLRKLGDLAGGNSEAFKRMAVNFAEIAGNGKAMTRDLRQFTTAGVPLIKQLSKQLGKTTNQIQEMAANGKISFKDVSEGITAMTGAGGAFFNAMELGAKTLSGRFNRLRDIIQFVSDAIGTALSPVAKNLVEDLIKLGEATEKWAKLNKEVIGKQFKKYVTIIKDFAIAVFENREAIFKWTKIIIEAVFAMKALQLVMAGFNFVAMVASYFSTTAAITAETAAVNKNTAAKTANRAASGVTGGFSSIGAGSGFAGGKIGAAKGGLGAVGKFGVGAFIVSGILAGAHVAVEGFKALQARDNLKLRQAQSDQRIQAGIDSLTNDQKAGLNAVERTALGLPPASSSASATVTIRDDTGKVDVTKSTLTGIGSGIDLVNTGTF